MEKKLEDLNRLYLELRKIEHLINQRYAIDFNVNYRAYTDEETKEDLKLEKKIEEKKAEHQMNIKLYAQAFTRKEEFDEIAKLLDEKIKEEKETKGYYDERKYNAMRRILAEANEEFEVSRNRRI